MRYIIYTTTIIRKSSFLFIIYCDILIFMHKILWSELSESGQVAHVAYAAIQRQKSVSLHTHDFAEVFWINSGVVCHEMNGCKRLVKSGEVVWIMPDDCHGFTLPKKGHVEFFNTAFPYKILQHLITRYGNEAPVSGKEFYLSPDKRNKAKQLLRQLSTSNKSMVLLDQYLLYLLSTAYHTNNYEGYPEWLREACERIREPEHFCKGVAGFASLCGYSYAHTARETKRLTGKTPLELVNEARLAWSASMLISSNKTILEISMGCGFESLSHFYQVFRAKYGIPPRQYRLKSQMILPIKSKM